MLSRRGFVGCSICALTGFAATGAGAEDTSTSGLKRTLLSKVDGPAEGYETIEARVEIGPGAKVARHTHFGVETSYVLDGEIHFEMQGAEKRTYRAGEGYQVPKLVPHGGMNGDKPTTLAVVYVVEKGKPLATPA